MATKLRIHRPKAGSMGGGLNVIAALRILLRAHTYAKQRKCRIWEFAVDIQELRAADVELSDLRWLVAEGFVQHGQDRTASSASCRSIRRVRNPTFTNRTCFVLTDRGVRFAKRALHGSKIPDRPRRVGGVPNPKRRPARVTAPKWDAGRHTLWLGNVVVKQFKEPASNQETILDAFQEEGWPPRIDDPLPPRAGSHSKKRLHDAIHYLNKSQTACSIRFHGDGTGRGVCWKHGQ